MDLLTKHFGEFFSAKPSEFNGSKEHEEAVKESLTKLICDYNIESNEEDLFKIICHFSWLWCIMVGELEFPSSDSSFYRDCKLLLSVLKPDVISPIDLSRIEFGDKASHGIITDPNILYILLRHLDIPSLTEQLENHLNNKNIFINKEPKKLNDIKLKFIKTCLLPLFEYLKNETNLKTESNNTIYRFIKDFTFLAGVEWDVLSTQSDPASYLKKTFSLINGSK